MTYTFTLRDGVKFHNGKAVTAEDVVYSLKRFEAESRSNARILFLLITKTSPLKTATVFPLTIQFSLDPHIAVAAGTDEILFNVFEGLVKPDKDGNFVEAVAVS